MRAPFDAGDGYVLATALDDIVDHTEQAAAQLGLTASKRRWSRRSSSPRCSSAPASRSSQALRCLRTGEELAPHLVEIHRLENEGDRLQRDGVASLFAEGIDPMVVIRWKDIFESLEAAVDACETVAHVLEGIVLKRRGRRRYGANRASSPARSACSGAPCGAPTRNAWNGTRGARLTLRAGSPGRPRRSCRRDAPAT